MQKLVVVYGFENSQIIKDINDLLLCKSIYNHNPVYAAPLVIEDANIHCIIYKVKNMEFSNPDLFMYVDELAKIEGKKAYWQIVLSNCYPK